MSAKSKTQGVCLILILFVELLITYSRFYHCIEQISSVKSFILNNGEDPESSDNPEKAIISLQMNRGTHYKTFIEMMDALQGVYYEIYGERVGLSAADFRKLNLQLPDQKEKYTRAREGFPMNISIAEPHKTN